MSLASLLSRRLLFTVGKGGVGRTTVTLALALEAAKRGKRVLAVELEGARGLERALGGLRRAPVEVPGLERVSSIAIDGRRALEEYLEMIIPVRRLLSTVFDSDIYQYFVAAAPGLKELMTIGKIWYEADRTQSGATDAPDLVVVDAPATGHSLQYLRMPEAAGEAFSVGLVHREAERVLKLLRDPAATATVVVSTAEEMPANETSEILSGVGEIGLCVGALVVNQVHRSPCDVRLLDGLERGLAAEPASGSFALLSRALACARYEAGWAAINRAQLDRLRGLVDAPVAALPYIFCEEFGSLELIELARTLGRELEGVENA